MKCIRILRLLLASMVALAAVKLLFNRQRTEESVKYIKKVSNNIFPVHFWQSESANDLRTLSVLPDPENIMELSEENFLLNLDGESIVAKTRKTYTGPLRVVHLDLKGAAPKVSYFHKLFPLIASLGADGILLEYEDMFPYEGDLEILRSPFSYTPEDIEEIKNLANLHNLELIPLVQVFGHFEFVLKHKRFFDLREVADFPNSLNPLVPKSLLLVKKMLIQVLKKHPQTQWFHIGADEVWGLGESEDSKKWLKEHGDNPGALFLSHVTKVCRFLAEVRPEIKLIFWEDMLRKIDSTLIKESGLTNLSSPMIWNYNPNLDSSMIGKLLTKYQQVGFQTVWFASAFKGASGISQSWTPINHHLLNHLGWLSVMNTMSKFPSIKFEGIALTGWQRYEHHTVLCELLPVAIPSLAVCLQTLKYGSFNTTVENEVQKHLGCKVNLNDNRCEGRGTFPGIEIYYMVEKIHGELRGSTEKMTQHYHVKGAFSPYQRKNNYANPRNIGYFKDELFKILKEWDLFMEKFEKEMMTVFFQDTVEEWMEENVNQHMNALHSLVKDVDRIVKLKGQKNDHK